VASLLDRPSEALLIVLGQKYLAQLKKQARALHEERADVDGEAVDLSGAPFGSLDSSGAPFGSLDSSGAPFDSQRPQSDDLATGRILVKAAE
jgi:hypothetical protein